jgi:ABC-2 type transport system permease protein
MKPFLALIRVIFRNYYGISAMKQKYLVEKKELWQPILAVMGIGVGIAFIFSMAMLFSDALYNAGKMLGEPGIVLVLSFLVVAFITFIFDIGTTISTFYFAQDNAILAALPLKPLQVVLARFSLVVTNQYLSQAIILLPPLIVFGIGEGLGIPYIILAALIFLLFPALPLAPAAVISILLMSRAGSKRLKDIFTILTYVIIIVSVFGIQFFMQSLPEGDELSSLESIIQTHGALLTEIGQSFPPAVWVTKALTMVGTAEGMLNLGFFLLLTGALVTLMLYLGEKYFYRGLFAGEEVAKKHRIINNRKSIWKASSPFKALVLREHRLFIRTPVFLMNVLPVAIIVPVFAVLPLLAQKAMFEFRELGSYLVKYPYLKLSIIAFMTFVAGTLPLSPSAFSREGKLFPLSQLIPASPREQVKAKFWYILAINFICTLPLFALCIFMLHLTWTDTLMLAVLALVMAAAVTGLGMIIDFARPYFDWEDPQRAVKNNLNVLFIMLITLLFMAITGGISVGLALFAPWWLGYSILLLLISAITVSLYLWIMTLAEKKYRQYEL